MEQYVHKDLLLKFTFLRKKIINKLGQGYLNWKFEAVYLTS